MNYEERAKKALPVGLRFAAALVQTGEALREYRGIFDGDPDEVRLREIAARLHACAEDWEMFVKHQTILGAMRGPGEPTVFVCPAMEKKP